MNDSRRKPLAIGPSDFGKLRKAGAYYVDKSMFIKEVIECSAEVLLLPRPRRFGKTLNLTMLKYFFEKSAEEPADLFKGLAIGEENIFKEHLGRYPVIFFTFKDMKELSWESLQRGLTNLIRDEYLRHKAITGSDILSESEKKYFVSILNNEAEFRDYADALRYLSDFLQRFHDQPVVILIDEYDTPVQAGYQNGYYDEVINFLRNFLSGGLKDNKHLFKGVVSGILRVARESIFSGLNNPGVYTLLTEEFNTGFGFTEKEVKTLLSDFDIAGRYDEVSYWYNGYNFGGRVIYNPWSILNYAASKKKQPRLYWINTGDPSIINNLATKSGKALREELGRLVEGKAITKPVYENIVMTDLNRNDNLLWSFLLFSGYLKIVEQVDYENYKLQIPNQEVSMIYRDLIRTWFDEKIEANSLEEMLAALENGDVDLFERLLGQVVMQVMSYHDFSSEPEKVYHALILGMLVWLSGKYEIRSNRESGYGRYDVMLLPKDLTKQGIILEFKKVYEDKTPEDTLEEALKQIETRQYEAELKAAGVVDILKLAVAFQGKKLWIKKG